MEMLIKLHLVLIDMVGIQLILMVWRLFNLTDSAEHDFGTGDFSMEFWWWPESLTGGTGVYI